MSKYSYQAKTAPRQTIQGDIEAESEQDAIQKLTKMGYFPISVKPEEITSGKKQSWRLRKGAAKDLTLVTRQLSSLVQSGVNILNGLTILSSQITNKYFKAVLDDIIAKIKDGKSLSESLAAYPDLFSNLYTSMVHSGEVGGNLEETLKRLADFLDREEEFKNSLRAALTYPIFILVVGILTIGVLVTFVIPRLVTMFEDMGQALPLPTQLLISLSRFLAVYWWLVLIVIAMVMFFINRFHRSAQGKLIWDSSKLKIFVIGDIVLKTEISRLTRTLSLLFSSGTPTVQAIEISASILENQLLKTEILKFRDQISNGSSFSQCLVDSKLFPSLVVNIVKVGEEAGSLEKALLRIADDYERDVDRDLKAFTRLLEPVIILGMGLIVGFIVLSMLLPIFQMNLMTR
ncbi:MAG: type II secretion system F family protein [Candidatus Omnitrophota bacterium]